MQCYGDGKKVKGQGRVLVVSLSTRELTHKISIQSGNKTVPGVEIILQQRPPYVIVYAML